MNKRELAAKRYQLWKTDLEWLNHTFLKNLIEAMPTDMEIGMFLDICFGVKHREIAHWTCIKAIRLEGACWAHETRGAPTRMNPKDRAAVETFKEGQSACIRIDQREAIVTIQNKYGCINVSQERWKHEYEFYFMRLGHRDRKPRTKST